MVAFCYRRVKSRVAVRPFRDFPPFCDRICNTIEPMSPRHRGRKAAVIAFLCTASVVVLAAVFRKELVTHFYCRQLVKDPQRIISMVEAHAGSIDRLALGFVAKTPAGRTALLDAFLRLLTRIETVKPELSGAGPVLIWIEQGDFRYVVQGRNNVLDEVGGGRIEALKGEGFKPGTFSQVWSHLVDQGEAVLSATQYPESRFEVLTGERARALRAKMEPAGFFEPLPASNDDPPILFGRLSGPPPGSS